MDDGGIETNNSTSLCIDDFTYEEVLLLQKTFMENFQLRTRLEDRGLRRQFTYIFIINVSKLGTYRQAGVPTEPIS